MKEPYLLLRTRIFFAMILLVFVSFLLIGITTSFQIRDNSLYYHELRLDRKEAQLQRAFNILFNEKSLQPDNQLSYLFNRIPDVGINISTVLDEDLTTNEEFAGSIIGGILAFLFIVYIMSGSMYPAIDLGAGEKERGTMETLISTNISSVDNIIGKMFSVTSSAVLTAIFSLLGFAVPLIVIFLFYGDSIPENAFEIISAIVNPVAIIAMFGLLIPLSIFMGAFMLAVSIYSKNPKEASLLLGNAVIIFFIPAYVPLINPGIELDLVGSLIPCYSFALHTNALIAGNTDWFLYGATLISNIIYCSIAIYVTYIMFDDEKIIFRS